MTQAPEALPLIRHIGLEDSGIEHDPVLRQVLERFLGDARDDLMVPGGRTVETVLAALADPAPLPPQYVDDRNIMAFWGCSQPDCRLKAAVVLSLRHNIACVILHHTVLDPADPATLVPDRTIQATATFHADIFAPAEGPDGGRVRETCRRELVHASQRARPQGYWLARGVVTLRRGPYFRPDPGLSAEAGLWDGRDPNL
ncbi:MAG: hypothetical protein P1U88_18275 [Thalassobaculaceae bacterium]|nr:hypothetical protein [Thalassobaculaceae bacterium]